MWNIKIFKNESQARQWMKKNERKYRMSIVFINNGIMVEYCKLIKVY